MGARASEHEVKEKRGTLTASRKGMCSWEGRDPFLFSDLGKPVFV